MNKYIIIGAGGMAAEICSYIKDIHAHTGDAYEIAGFMVTDKSDFTKSAVKYGFTAEFFGDPMKHEYSGSFSYVCAIANPLFRLRLMDIVMNHPQCFPNLIHPTSIVSESTDIGFGNVISPFCVVGPNVRLENLNAMTSYSFLSHDCSVGSCNIVL